MEVNELLKYPYFFHETTVTVAKMVKGSHVLVWYLSGMIDPQYIDSLM